MKRFLCAVMLGAIVLTGCSSSSSASPKSAGSSNTSASSQSAGSSVSSAQNGSSSSADESGMTDEQAAAKLAELKKNCFTDGTKFPQLDAPEKGDKIAVLHTSKGDIKIKLCPEQAPLACENFEKLIENGYYNGITFHRVINNFMIQGGDPTGTGTGGESAFGKEFADEFNGDMYAFRGALCMANRGADTNTSQFFIVQKKDITSGYFDYTKSAEKQYGDSQLLYNSETNKIFRVNYSQAAIDHYNKLGGCPDLDFGYTIFGQVIEGMDVVDSIAAVKTGDKDKPTEDVTITKAEITEY
jgi:cyclophilin family peptidyl-prolyl cis-trans isomerase